MKVLSKSSVYGLRALLFIVSREDHKGYISISEISKELDISFHFLTKIFQALTQNGLLISYRGPKGGVALQRQADQIKLIEVIAILEGDDFFNKCILSLPDCSDNNPCPAHEIWKKTRNELKDNFEKVTLADMGNKVKVGHMRLSG